MKRICGFMSFLLFVSCADSKDSSQLKGDKSINSSSINFSCEGSALNDSTGEKIEEKWKILALEKGMVSGLPAISIVSPSRKVVAHTIEYGYIFSKTGLFMKIANRGIELLVVKNKNGSLEGTLKYYKNIVPISCVLVD